MKPDCPRVLFYTKYARNGASSRYRIYQYLPLMQKAGLDVHVIPLFNEAYLDHYFQSGSRGLKDILCASAKRITSLLAAKNFNLVVIEYELLPYCPAFFEQFLCWLGTQYLVDYDDALFHQYDMHQNPLVRFLLSGKIASVMRQASMVIAGNQYLADYALRSGGNQVEILPTVIDLARYPIPVDDLTENDVFTVGWIGSSSTSNYLFSVAPALTRLCKENICRVRLIGASKINLPDVPVEILPWSEDTEVA